MPVILCFGTLQLIAQSQYSDFNTISRKISQLSKSYPSLCEVKTLVKTTGGKDIFVLTIGTGERDTKPGVAILGGIDGVYIAGRELALGFAENILRESANPEIKSLLTRITFYVFPDVSPDASEQFFSNLKYERSVNANSTDDDRDFAFNEDPNEDLNNDGIITLMRVTDPTGNYIESDEDKRVMVTADISKGQKGSYRVYSEGIDNDKDEKFNKDGTGGVILNKNFTFNYEEFGSNSGFHAVSEVETKALADFLYDHFNIYMTFAFGPQDNLGFSMKASEKQGAASPVLMDQGGIPGQTTGRGQRMEASDRKISSVTKSDEVIYKLVSDRYHEITGIKGAPVTINTPGNFMDWSYFHYGRYSFSTPAWWFTVEKGKNAEADFLKHADNNKMENIFVPWTEIKHPDFPDKKTEVGGIKPFIMVNPPADSLNNLISRNYKFLLSLAAMHPELEFLDIKTENAGENIFRISLKVHNKGLFATCTQAGEANRWTRIMRIILEPENGQTFLSGPKIQRISRLEGDSSAEFSWLISGKGKVAITAGAVNTGTIKTTLELK